jgi:TatD DNase family protein
MWIDAHAHLYDLTDDQIDSTIKEAGLNKIGLIVSTATNMETSQKVVRQCTMNDSIYGAAGISPFDTESIENTWYATLEEILTQPKIIALGEIGLDISNPRYPSLETQLPIFGQQLQLANEHNLPVVVHSRGYEKETAEICRKTSVKRAMFHCFTGDYDAAKKIIDNGYLISFSGILTFKNAEIRNLLPKIPIEHIVIETDTPYLAPVPFRGKRNYPALVRYTGKEVARILNMDVELVEKQLYHNFVTYFNVQP